MAERAASREPFVPAVYQPPLPTDRLILKHGSPGAGDRTELDVLIVGAGPAGVARPGEVGNIAERGGGGGGGIGGAPQAAGAGAERRSGAVGRRAAASGRCAARC